MKKNKKTDERQEYELMKIMNFSFWIMFITIGTMIIIQNVFFHASFQQIIGEFISILVGSAAMLVGCIMKGQWDSYTKPSIKVYVAAASVAATITGILLIIRAQINKGAITTHLIPFLFSRVVCVFIITFIFISVTGIVINKREIILAKKYNDV